MIDEKKLIEILSKNSIFEKITNAEGKNIFEIIDEQPKTDDWIPCEERLPSEHGEYLVTHKEIKDGKIRYRTNYDVFNTTTKKWTKAEVRYAKLEVVAWQEDIPPYEEAKEREGKCEFEEFFPSGNAYLCKKTALICSPEKLKYCKCKKPYKKEDNSNENT